MLRTVFLLTCIVLLFSVGIEGSVIELSDENFGQEVAKHDLMLVEFYAPWCGHCKQLAPKYLKAAEKLQLSTPPIPLANVDCIEKGKQVCETYKIEGYPMLKLFRNGEFSADYKGPRDSDGIVSYMEKMATPSSQYISSEEKLRAFIDHAEPSIVGFFKHDSDSFIKSSFVNCSEKFRTDFRFAHTYETPSYFSQDTILPEKTQGEQVWLYQPFRLRTKLDTPAIRIPESDPEKMQEFIIKHFMGVVGIRDLGNSEHFDTPDRNPQCVFYTKICWDLNRKTTMYWRNRILKLAKQFESRMYFAMSSLTDFEQELMQKFGIIQADQMQAIITNNGHKYIMSQDTDAKMSVELLSKFVRDFFDGEIKPYLKSEPEPIGDSDAVKLVVGTTFEKIVMEKGKDVMIEFYAPWCGHCQSLSPKYYDLGVKLRNNSNVVIAKIDATANDFPDAFQVEGFPTIYWVPANDKANPVKYEGGRETADFLSYIEKMATIPFTKNRKDEL